MIAFLIPLLRRLVFNPKVLLALAVAAAVGFAWWRWEYMKDTIAEQTETIEELQADLAFREKQIALKEHAAAELQSRLAEQKETNRELNSILQDVTAAGPEQDGPVAPVLRGALERLRKHAASEGDHS